MITPENNIPSIIYSRNLRKILLSKELAHLGDFLVNFVYTSVKIINFSIPGSVHVWDYCLKNAIDKAELRIHLGKKTKPDKVADAAEALVAFAYYTKLLSLDDMIEIITEILIAEDFKSEKSEKEACTEAFGVLLKEIFDLALRSEQFGI